MKSTFVLGEVVRVQRLVGWPPDANDIVGTEGRVISFHPKDPSGWEVCVWLYELREVWCFGEEELVATGHVELILEQGGATVRPRAEVGTLTDPPPLTLRVFPSSGTSISTLETTVREELARLGGLEKASSSVRRNQLSDADQVYVQLWPESDASGYFERLVHGGDDSGWIRKFDDGWSCDFWWSRVSSTVGRFLADDIEQAAVSLTPWSNPSRRRVITRTCGSTTRSEARRTFLVDQNEIRWR